MNPADFSENDNRIIINDLLNECNIDRKTFMNVNQARAAVRGDLIKEWAKEDTKLQNYGDVIEFIAQRMKHYSMAIKGKGFVSLVEVIAQRMPSQMKKEHDKYEED